MSDLKAAAIRVAVLKALIDKVTAVDETARGELLAAMLDSGAEKVTAELADGTKVSSVSLCGGDKAVARVVDDRAFLAWVKLHRPDEVEEKVRASFKKVVLDEAAATGEEIPGVELGISKAYVANRFKTGGKDAVAEAWTKGTLSLREVLALQSGGE
jgi:hypothetical protein